MEFPLTPPADSHNAVPTKRAAVEPASSLFEREAEPIAPLPRPNSIVGGVTLIVFRAVAAAVWLTSFIASWNSMQPELDLEPDEAPIVLGVIIGFQVAWVLTLLFFAWQVFRGSNVARFLVQLWTVGSITTSAIAYFSMGQGFTVRTTLITLGIDILVLLALTSRSSREWTRQRSELRRAARKN